MLSKRIPAWVVVAVYLLVGFGIWWVYRPVPISARTLPQSDFQVAFNSPSAEISHKHVQNLDFRVGDQVISTDETPSQLVFEQGETVPYFPKFQVAFEGNPYPGPITGTVHTRFLPVDAPESDWGKGFGPGKEWLSGIVPTSWSRESEQKVVFPPGEYEMRVYAKFNGWFEDRGPFQLLARAYVTVKEPQAPDGESIDE